MDLFRRIGRWLRPMTIPLLGLSALAYIAIHAVQGDRGLLAWWHLSEQIDRTRAELTRTSTDVTLLRRRVNLLRPENLDRDMLDERVRAVLLLADPQDILIEDDR